MVTRHGRHVEEPPQDVFLSDDPHIALIHADMGAWLRAHPCDCHGPVCRCDEPYDPNWERDLEEVTDDPNGWEGFR